MKRQVKYQILLIAVFVCYSISGRSFASSAYPKIAATQAGMVDFKVYSNLSADDMAGVNDVSGKLQQAINHARDQFKTLFIPSGTYLITKPIDCISTNQNNHKGHGAIVIVGSQKVRPIFRLKDNSNAFQGTGLPSQVTGPRPLFGIRKIDYPTKNLDWLFYCGIRSIDIDLGVGNPGAIGISWASAQNCFLEEITIKAHGCFAGVAGLPGANGLTADVEVQGGRYGFYLTLQSDNATLWAQASVTTVVGCRLYNQTENAMRINGFGGVTLIGMHVIKQNGTALWLRGSGNTNECPLSLIDSKIELEENDASNRVIDNSGRSTIGLINVYTRNSSNVCFNNNTENLLASGATTDWTRISRYNYVAKSGKNTAGIHYVDGILSNSDIVSQEKSTPPDNLISRHIWSSTPSFEDDDVVLVTNEGANHRQIIQSAIDRNKKVMLAAGIYALDGPIVLRDSTILFGAPGYRVFLTNQSGWTPSNHVWIIDTDDAPNATTYLFDISTDAPMNNYWGGVRWRAGRNSLVRHIANNRVYGGAERNIKRVYITGSGGGRWYGYADHHTIYEGAPVDQNHRKVVIEGTSQPLTFYGLNLERGGGYAGVVSSFPMLEIENSSNVRVFGAKTETYQPYALISNSSNVFFTNIDDWCIHNKNLSAQHYIEIRDVKSSNIEILNAQWNLPPSSLYKIVKDPWSENTPSRTEFMGLYRVGSVDFNVFVTSSESTPRRIQFPIGNLSVRSTAGSGDQTLIVGFVVSGDGQKRTLIRGIGPTLVQFGVNGAVVNPQLKLFNAAGAQINQNDDWGGSTVLANAFAQAGAFALTATSRDAALLLSLAPGGYTAQVSSDASAGVALVEAYDVDTITPTARYVNLSARNQVGTGDSLLIVGFNISGNTAKTLLIRGVGPTLGQFGIGGVLTNPRLQVYNGTNLVADNDDWGGSAALSTAFSQAGAFALPANSRDAALLLELQPGTYTAQVSGVANATGVALVEVYDMQ